MKYKKTYTQRATPFVFLKNCIFAENNKNRHIYATLFLTY